MQPRFIDQFDVIILDMGYTFMFNCDRFSEIEDFGTTYYQLGGKYLAAQEVNSIIYSVFNTMLIDYENPDYYDCFPSILSYLETNHKTRNLPKLEVSILEQVFAVHEAGTIPETYTKILHQLHQTHRLAVVSNIWSKSDLYLQEFKRVGIEHLFDAIIFSSDYGCIKPSISLFNKAIEAVDVERSKIVFVGDSLKYDIAGAKAAGLSTIWINNGIEQAKGDTYSPDLIIRDLPDLLVS